MHPDVKSGKKTEDDVLGEFLDTFELHYSLNVSNINILTFVSMKIQKTGKSPLMSGLSTTTM